MLVRPTFYNGEQWEAGVSPLPGDAGSIPSLRWPCDTHELIHFSEARMPDYETGTLFLFPCGLLGD